MNQQVSPLRVHVVKLGGSLLERGDLVRALSQWVDRQQSADPSRHLLLVVGGGGLVDGLRKLAKLHALPDPAAHWLAIGLMETNTRLLAEARPGWPLVGCWKELMEVTVAPRVSWALPEALIRSATPSLGLEESWRVTSDSIAASIAVRLGAGLTLFKSKPPQTHPSPGGVTGSYCAGGPVSPIDWRGLASGGFVDPVFPEFACNITDLRTQTLPPALPT